MTFNADIRERWRQSAADRMLAVRLLEAGCPLGLRQILENAGVPQPSLNDWVRHGLNSGMMLRTAQAELLVRGRTLQETAEITGTDARLVLYYLAEPEWESDRFGAALADSKPEIA